jgi:hypothetical protein
MHPAITPIRPRLKPFSGTLKLVNYLHDNRTPSPEEYQTTSQKISTPNINGVRHHPFITPFQF